MTVTMNEGYFRLFFKAKMGIFLNYGGAGSHHGGAGRITLISKCSKCYPENFVLLVAPP